MIVGEFYLDHVGEMKFINHKTGDNGVLTL